MKKKKELICNLKFSGYDLNPAAHIMDLSSCISYSVQEELLGWFGHRYTEFFSLFSKDTVCFINIVGVSIKWTRFLQDFSLALFSQAQIIAFKQKFLLKETWINCFKNTPWPNYTH